MESHPQIRPSLPFHSQLRLFLIMTIDSNKYYVESDFLFLTILKLSNPIDKQNSSLICFHYFNCLWSCISLHLHEAISILYTMVTHFIHPPLHSLPLLKIFLISLPHDSKAHFYPLYFDQHPISLIDNIKCTKDLYINLILIPSNLTYKGSVLLCLPFRYLSL